jgi:hypothetical protein
MSLTTAVPLLITDPGFIFIADLGTAEPTHAALASTYDLDVWGVAWVSAGATEDGSKFKYASEVEAVEVAEFLDPIKYATTGRAGSFAFAMANYTLKNIQRVFNGGTVSTVSGSGVTLSSKYVPPAPGGELRRMIGYESLDHTFRIVMYQCLQGGEMETVFGRAPSKSLLPAEFKFEVPSSGNPFAMYGAGTGRLGV